MARRATLTVSEDIGYVGKLHAAQAGWFDADQEVERREG
jgi:hypothetical protein